MSNSRTRMAAIAGSLALSLSVALAPGAMATSESPEAAVEGLLAAIEAKDFEALPSFFTPELADEMGGLDFASVAEEMPEGLDAQMFLDALLFETEIIKLEVLSQSDTEAVVALEGTMSMGVNAEALTPFIEALVDMSGMEVTDENIEMFSAMMMAEFEAESEDISEEISLVLGEDGSWLINSELGGDDEMMVEDMSGEDSSEEMTEETTEEMTEEESGEGDA